MPLQLLAAFLLVTKDNKLPCSADPRLRLSLVGSSCFPSRYFFYMGKAWGPKYSPPSHLTTDRIRDTLPAGIVFQDLPFQWKITPTVSHRRAMAHSTIAWPALLPDAATNHPKPTKKSSHPKHPLTITKQQPYRRDGIKLLEYTNGIHTVFKNLGQAGKHRLVISEQVVPLYR